MVFRIKDANHSELAAMTAKAHARAFVLLSRKNAAEKTLDKYMTERFGAPLVPVCLKIIANATYSFDSDGDVVITIVDKKLDELASLITYGTGKVQGSNILRNAFGQL